MTPKEPGTFIVEQQHEMNEKKMSVMEKKQQSTPAPEDFKPPKIPVPQVINVDDPVKQKSSIKEKVKYSSQHELPNATQLGIKEPTPPTPEPRDSEQFLQKANFELKEKPDDLRASLKQSII